MKLFKLKTPRGVRLADRKETADYPTHEMPAPPMVRLPMIQHIGAPCRAAVRPGDRVLVGQVVGELPDGGALGAPIHSSVSGKVRAVEPFLTPTGQRCDSVVVESDGAQELAPGLEPPRILNRDQFLEAVKRSGLVGLGGAGFPTWAKLTLRPDSRVDTLLINAAECEPFLTSDYREMLENPKDILAGMAAVAQWLELEHVVLAIERNKPRALALYQKYAREQGGFRVCPLPRSYPQGAEKVLIRQALGRVVREGQLPSHQGVIVMNVSSVGFLGDYLRTGMPLVRRRVTVEGGAVAKPQNLLVPVGTSLGEVAEACGGFSQEPRKLLMGGPMMGMALDSLDFPVLKNTNGLLFLNGKQAHLLKPSLCIRCGRCLEVCPVRLAPAPLERAFEQKDVQRLAELKVNLCIECGCCSYVCPARRPLVQANRASKRLLRETQR